MDKVILIDCDGVLTDGCLTIDHNGEKQFKRFHSRDVRAIRELIFNGWQVYIVSADDWPGIFHFAEKVGAEVIISRDKSEVSSSFSEYFAIGDDAWDVDMLRSANRAFIPSDADNSCRALPGVHVCNTAGGRGVVAEVARLIL